MFLYILTQNLKSMSLGIGTLTSYKIPLRNRKLFFSNPLFCELTLYELFYPSQSEYKEIFPYMTLVV